MFYAMDDWKVTPRLTVNLGLRYELNPPWFDKHNNMSQLDLTPGPRFNQVVMAGYCGDSWSCRGLVSTDTNNWAPRLGIAWRLRPKTVIRAASGVLLRQYPGCGRRPTADSELAVQRSVGLVHPGRLPRCSSAAAFPRVS